MGVSRLGLELLGSGRGERFDGELCTDGRSLALAARVRGDVDAGRREYPG